MDISITHALNKRLSWRFYYGHAFGGSVVKNFYQGKKSAEHLHRLQPDLSKGVSLMYMVGKQNTAILKEPLLSREEMMDALGSSVRRMDAIEAKCMSGFPLYSPGATDQWTISWAGSWIGDSGAVGGGCAHD